MFFGVSFPPSFALAGKQHIGASVLPDIFDGFGEAAARFIFREEEINSPRFESLGHAACRRFPHAADPL